MINTFCTQRIQSDELKLKGSGQKRPPGFMEQ